nr:Ankyrin repeat domain containing protein [Pandoravirus aubagnensis]
MDVPLERDQPDRTHTTLCDLPVEMIDAILSRMDDPCDVARCRMASRVFWTRENRPQDRYPESACTCSRHLRMPMPRSQYHNDTPCPGHGYTCYSHAISHALARGLVGEADWLWQRYLSALCVPRTFGKTQRSVFPYTTALEYTAEHVWYATVGQGDIAAVRWAHNALVSIGLRAKPCDHYYEAAARGHTDVILWLLNAGLIQDTWSAAKYAARGGHLDLTRTLLDARRRLSHSIPFGGVWTSAAYGGHPDVAMMLLYEFGVGFERSKSREQCRTFDVETAASTGMIDALALLWQKHGAAQYAEQAMLEAIKERRINVVEWLVSMGTQPDSAEIASACPCRGHGPRGPTFDHWRRSRYRSVVSCIAIECAIKHRDASALETMGVRKIRPHAQGRCRCDREIDWRRFLGDVFHEANNPNAPTPRNKEAVAAMKCQDSDVSRMTIVMAQACPRMCVAAGWLDVAIRTFNKGLVEALLPHADPWAAYHAAYAACRIGDQRLFVHLAALARGYHTLRVTLQNTRDARMAAFLIDSGIVDKPSVYALGDMVSRGDAPIVEAMIAWMTHDDLPAGLRDDLLARATEAGSADTISILLGSTFAASFNADAYHKAMIVAARRGLLDLVVQLADAMRTFGHEPDPQIVACASVCARLAHDDDHTATASPLSTDEVAVMKRLIDGAVVPMHDYYVLRLDTCIQIMRLIRRWPRLATAKLVRQLISTGIHAAWLEQLHATHPKLFQDNRQIETLVNAAVEMSAPDLVRWLCRRCTVTPSFAAKTALGAVRRCDVATAQCLLIDGKGATACKYDALIEAAASAGYDTVAKDTFMDKYRWRAYADHVLSTTEKAAADRLRVIDAGSTALPFVLCRESKARAWVTTWADTCWRPAKTGIEPTGACHLFPTSP